MKAPQQGMALIEALVASAVLGIGLLGVTQLSLKTLHIASDTRQRGLAQLLAQEAFDCAVSGTDCPSQYSIEVQGVRYTRQTRITPRGSGVQDVQVTVQSASPKAIAGSTESASLVWHSSVSPVPGWVGR